jgi:hypothetical protein
MFFFQKLNVSKQLNILIYYSETIGPSLGGLLLETFDFPISATVMAFLSFGLALFVLIYFSSIRSPYESQLCQSSKDSRERTTDADSGISDNILGITSRSSSTSSLEYQSGSGTANETTPLMMSRSFDDRDKNYGQFANVPHSYKYTSGMDSSFGSFPDVLKTVCITGAGAVEV